MVIINGFLFYLVPKVFALWWFKVVQKEKQSGGVEESNWRAETGGNVTDARGRGGRHCPQAQAFPQSGVIRLKVAGTWVPLVLLVTVVL